MSMNSFEDFLNTHHIHYEKIQHPRTYTAQETAAAAHVSGREFAKTVMVKIDGRMVMIVLPANYRIDPEFIRKISGAHTVELASESEFKDIFPDCEVGAMPPFGNLYDVEVWSDESLMWDEEIAFNAGSHTELMKLATTDFKELVHPKVIRFETGL